ncbi:MAG TPA: hypothetical protein VGM19_08905 [Armatimonadota bacterium]|jgi:hypothetical protein
MISEAFRTYASSLPLLVEGLTQRQLDPILQRLRADQQWEFMGVVTVTASEVAARLLIDCLLANGQYAALIPAACLRRQMRSPAPAGATLGATAFRDYDAETDLQGVPEHIMAEAEDIAAEAKARRTTASYQAAAVDRDPLRSMIVTKLAEQIVTQPEAAEALITIARGSAWEETRRDAAMKVVNNQRLLQRLVAEGRVADLSAVADSARLQAAREKIADAMEGQLETYQAEANQAALVFLAENHRDPALRLRLKQAGS